MSGRNNNNYRTKGLEANDDDDVQPVRPPTRRTTTTTIPGATKGSSARPSQEREQARPHGVFNSNSNFNSNFNSNSSPSPLLNQQQIDIKAFMFANTPHETTLPPGAVAVAGIDSQQFRGGNYNAEDDYDNVGEPSVVGTGGEDDDPSLTGVSPIVAQLAPDEEHVAARVAARVERQMAAQLTERLKQEVSAQLSEHRQSHVLAEAIISPPPPLPPPPPPLSPPISESFQNANPEAPTNNSTAPSSSQQHNNAGNNNSASNDGSFSNNNHNHHHQQQQRNSNNKSSFLQNDNFKICGLRRRCWGVVLMVILLILVGTAVGVVMYLRKDGTSLSSSGAPPSPTVATNTSPTASPTTSPTVDTSNWEYLLETIGQTIAPPNGDDPYDVYWDNPNTSQYKALEWLALDDEFSEEPQTMDEKTLVERYALAVLYYTTQGRDWRQDLYFLQPRSVCDWNSGAGIEDDSAKGVYCNGMPDGTTSGGTSSTSSSSSNSPPRRVSMLKMSELGLAGRIPWEIALLSDVLQLDMDINFILGTLPLEFSRLTNLQALWFKSNSLSGDLPFNLPPSLASLDLEDNGLTGTLPAEWGQSLTNLFYLGLRVNDIRGSLPISYQGLSNIRILDVEGNQVEGSIPSQYGVLTTLESLYVEKNKLEGTLSTELGRLVNLKQLFLYDNLLTGSFPQSFEKLTQLEFFWFHKNALIGTVDDILCVEEPFIKDLKGDCSGVQPEIACSCCTSCCTDDGATCVPN